MIARTAAGATVRLGDEIARGGEAVIRRVDGDTGLLAKVFVADRAGMADKLRAMRDHPPPDPAGVFGHSAIAWPRELLLDDSKRLIGFLMPYVRDAVPALDVLNPRRRAQTLPDFNRAYLHRTARNLASALAALHAAHVVVGDLNERNVLVTPRALVTLIDADSFQIQRVRAAEIVFYPCPVGRAEYTPPELQGQPFRDHVRLPEHDAFGLAVLLFQLLMGGSHPFRGAWLAAGDAPPLEEKIRRGWFPYLDRPPAPIAPPPGSPPIGTLHPALVEAFVRAFVHGHVEPHRRPTADDWARRLEEAEAHLIRCPSGHAFADHLAACPECGAVRRGASWTARRRRPASRVAVVAGEAGRMDLTRGMPPRGVIPPAMRYARVGLRTMARSVGRALAPAPPAQEPTPPLQRATRRVRRIATTILQACLAALGAVAIGGVVHGVARLGSAPSNAFDGALPQSVVGWFAGGAALAAVACATAATRRRTQPPTPSSSSLTSNLGRTIGEPVVGWTIGCVAAAALVAVAAWARQGLAAGWWGGSFGGALVTAAGSTAASSDVGWSVGWTIYGAVAGAWVVSDDAPAPGRAAALFAAIGYGVARGAVWLLRAMT